MNERVNVPPLKRRELPDSTRTALQFQETAATYTLSTGVDFRATHGIFTSFVRQTFAWLLPEYLWQRSYPGYGDCHN